MTQRKEEWIEKDNKDYHARQFRVPYRSTVAFCEWLETIGYIGPKSKLRIVDIGTGQGANLYYMGKRYPKCTFVGLDINEVNVSIGNEVLTRSGIDNCRLELGDVYDMDERHVAAYDGAISLQTLSWLPTFEEPLDSILGLRTKWLALTSLFYPGRVSCDISVRQYDESLSRDLDIHYNVYSLPVVEKFLHERGCIEFQAVDFEIDIDLPKPDSQLMSTYTRKLEDGSRLQISGPLLMPWYFVACQNGRLAGDR